MITTTEYIQRLTITTDDAGNVTTTRTATADTLTAFWFDELTPEAQQRAINDAIDQEVEDSYNGVGHLYWDECEIWEAAHDLEKTQPIYIGTDASGTPYGRARRYGWSRPDWESVSEAEDTGICWSMDICGKWNEYAARIVALQEAHEEATDRAWIHHENADTAHDNDAHEIEEAERRRAWIYEHIAERIENAAEELTEEAARAVGNIVDGLIEGEHEYYTSDEFWREWYSEGDERFTRDGERI